VKITLQPVTRANFDDVVRQKVAPGQENFVAPNTYSLAEAYVEPSWTPLAICDNETVVGFAMFGLEVEVHRWWIIRFMIGADHQGNGYGTAALNVLVDLMVERHAPRTIYLGYEPDNTIAERLYARSGFVPTGEIEEGEVIARLDVGDGVTG
jgi:diamine N-acetyltransferase